MDFFCYLCFVSVMLFCLSIAALGSLSGKVLSSWLSCTGCFFVFLISKFQVGLKSLLRQGLSEPDFYGDLVYKLKKIVGSNNFSAQFIKIISHYKKIGYNINVLQQTACLVVNPITVGNFAFLFNCTPVGWTSDSMMVPT